MNTTKTNDEQRSCVRPTAGAGGCKSLRRLATGVSILLLAGGPAGGGSVLAQQMEAGRGATVLTLRQALNLAVEHNPQYRQTVNRLDLLGLEQRQGWGAFLPSVDARYSTGQALRRDVSWIGFDGRPAQNPSPEWVGSSSARMDLYVNFEVFDGGRRFRERDRIRAKVRADRLNARVELDRILAQVQRQFLTVQRQKAQVALERGLLADRQRDLELTRQRFALALDRRPDLLAREFDVEQQRATLREAEGRVETAVMNLRVVIGDPALEALDVAESLPEPFDPASLNLASLVARARGESPAVRVQEEQVQMRRASLRAETARWWPRITASSSWGRSANEDGQTALFDLQPGRSVSGNASWGFSFTLPIFDNFRRSHNTASQRIELDNALESLRHQELQMELDVRTRFAALTTDWETLVLRERALELASQRLEIMREEYRLANVDIQPLRTAINEEARARRDAIDQRYAFALTLVSLYEAVGIVGEEAGIVTVPEQS